MSTNSFANTLFVTFLSFACFVDQSVGFKPEWQHQADGPATSDGSPPGANVIKWFSSSLTLRQNNLLECLSLAFLAMDKLQLT